MDGASIQRWAGILGATGVGMGAFGAHALKATLEANGRLSTFQTGGPSPCRAGTATSPHTQVELGRVAALC